MKKERIELSVHTKMSKSSAVTSVYEYINKATELTHEAIAFTDDEIFSFHEIQKMTENSQIKPIYGMEINVKDNQNSYWINILVKNQTGLENLYKIVSEVSNGENSNIKDFIKINRAGLLIGSSGVKGEVFQYAKQEDKKLSDAINFYDYIGICPIEYYTSQFDQSPKLVLEKIKSILKRITDLAIKLDKTVVATGDVYCLDKQNYKLDLISMNIKSSITEDRLDFGINNDKLANQYYLSTEQMLAEMSFLGDKLAYELVVTNTNLLANQIERITVFTKDINKIADDDFLETLQIPSAYQKIEQIVFENATILYGSLENDVISQRIKLELSIIKKQGDAPLYLLAHLLTKKAVQEGFYTSNRLSIGASFIAYLLKITSISPLVPHYICKKCHFIEFKENKNQYRKDDGELFFQENFAGVQSGFDLGYEICPNCKATLHSDGNNIFSEVHYGIDRLKELMLSINVEERFIPIASEYLETIFTNTKLYKTRNINLVTETNARLLIEKYLLEHKIELTKAKTDYIINKLEGTYKSFSIKSNQLFFVPDPKSIYKYSPILYIGNKGYASYYSAYEFDNNFQNIVLLSDKHLSKYSFIMNYLTKYPQWFSIPDIFPLLFDDDLIYGLFSGFETISVKPEKDEVEVATSAVSYLSSDYAKEIIVKTQPKSFAQLVKVIGLLYSSGNWNQNIEALINDRSLYHNITLDEIIANREDIMNDLIERGLDIANSFEIMEFVRSGQARHQSERWNHYKDLMMKIGVPIWYIGSMEQITYLFSKSQAIDMALISLWNAWCKIYQPLLFYSAYFSVEAQSFDYKAMVLGEKETKVAIKKLKESLNYKSDVQARALLNTMQTALEMQKRGFIFQTADLNESDKTHFVIKDNSLLLPLKSLDYLNEEAIEWIIEERKKAPLKATDLKFNKQQ